jgi:hypothetical protein
MAIEKVNTELKREELNSLSILKQLIFNSALKKVPDTSLLPKNFSLPSLKNRQSIMEYQL